MPLRLDKSLGFNNMAVSSSVIVKLILLSLSQEAENQRRKCLAKKEKKYVCMYERL